MDRSKSFVVLGLGLALPIVLAVALLPPSIAGGVNAPHTVIVSDDPIDRTPDVLGNEDWQVMAIAQIGDRVFVGGKFKRVREAGGDTAAATPVPVRLRRRHRRDRSRIPAAPGRARERHGRRAQRPGPHHRRHLQLRGRIPAQQPGEDRRAHRRARTDLRDGGPLPGSRPGGPGRPAVHRRRFHPGGGGGPARARGPRRRDGGGGPHPGHPLRRGASRQLARRSRPSGRSTSRPTDRSWSRSAISPRSTG